MQASFLSQLLQRLGSKSPAFFRKLQWIAGIISAAIWLFNSAVSANVIHFANVENVTNWLNTLGGGFAGILVGTLTTTTDPKLVAPEVKEAVITESTT